MRHRKVTADLYADFSHYPRVLLYYTAGLWPALPTPILRQRRAEMAS
jgi:hypothetical protein